MSPVAFTAASFLIGAICIAQAVRMVREHYSRKRWMQEAVGRVHPVESPAVMVRRQINEIRHQASVANNVNHHAGGIYSRTRVRPLSKQYDPTIPLPGSDEPKPMDDGELRWSRRPERKWG
jgi:hypothetical protein